MKSYCSPAYCGNLLHAHIMAWLPRNNRLHCLIPSFHEVFFELLYCSFRDPTASLLLLNCFPFFLILLWIFISAGSITLWGTCNTFYMKTQLPYGTSNSWTLKNVYLMQDTTYFHSFCGFSHTSCQDLGCRYSMMRALFCFVTLSRECCFSS